MTPSVSQHRQQAELNAAFLETISPTAFPGWAIVVCFYSALHWVDAVLAAEGLDPQAHHDRALELVRFGRRHNVSTLDLRAHYRELQEMSLEARYTCTPNTPEDLALARDEDLARVRSWARERLWRAGFSGDRT
jgi:hypothetical protein